MSAAGWISSIVVGLALFAVPFLRYAHFGDAAAAHADHRPRNGGVLRMVGDYHLEVRRRIGRVEVFASDAVRAPVRARAGWVSFGGAHREPLQGAADRLSTLDRFPRQDLRVEVELGDGTVLSSEFEAARAQRGSGPD